MKVLLVEDDDEKRQHIEAFMASKFPDAILTTARSLQSGLREIFSNQFDLLLLDMTMRNFDRTLEDDGGRPHAFGGREILRQMSRQHILVPTVIVTQFESFGHGESAITVDQLSENLRDRYENFRGTVQYRSNVDDWRDVMLELIDQLTGWSARQ